jgi:uncharacterized iron-regulated protein
MLLLRSLQICTFSFGAFLLLSAPHHISVSWSEPASQLQPENTRTTLLDTLKQTDIIYLAESHDDPAAHHAQLAIIQALHHNNRPVAIAMEMFQRPFQPVLDRYLAGDISEAQLREQSEYERRWGFDWEFYAPILRFAQSHNIPVIAANTPTEVSRQVSRNGLESLTEADRRYIPPPEEIRIEPPAYREYLQQIYTSHAGHGNSLDVERFILAQVLWDETMADAIARFWLEHPDTQIVVLAGKGHILYDYGIPSRVARRLENHDFTQKSVWLGEFPTDVPPPADYAWPLE